MRLTRIPGHEPTTKVVYSWKTSTVDLVAKYAQFYKDQTGQEVNAKEVTEQMLLDFMAEDKDFQKALKKGIAAPAAAPASASAPAQAE